MIFTIKQPPYTSVCLRAAGLQDGCDQLVVNVCVLLSAWCQLDADIGIPCAEYVQHWFFDKAIGACSAFWYGGCGGNANRFKTEHECLRTCGSHRKSWLHTRISGCGPPNSTFTFTDTFILGYTEGWMTCFIRFLFSVTSWRLTAVKSFVLLLN